MSALFDNPYYYLTKLFCSMTDLWPYQARKKKRVINAFSFLILFSYLPPQLKRLLQVWGKDMDAVCMCITPICAIFITMTKILTFRFFEGEMRILLEQIEAEWKKTLSEERKKILGIYASKSRTLCVAYTVIMCTALINFLLVPTTPIILDIFLPRNETRVRDLSAELDYGIDIQRYWLWLWLHTSAATVVVIFNVIGSDLMFITFSMHACYMFAVVKHKLEHVSDSITEYTGQTFENQNIICNAYRYKKQRPASGRRAIHPKECVISHVKTLEYARLVNYIYTRSLFVTVGTSVTAISIALIQLVSKISQWIEMITPASFLLGVTIQIFFISLIAQRILDHSSNVDQGAYSCAWYNMPAKMRKDIVLILMRSRAPSQLTAGKLLVISLENFCAIMQTAISYFMVLASLR